MKRSLMLLALLASLPVYAESIAHSMGKTVGQFGGGVGSELMNNMQQQQAALQPQWITIEPGSKQQCLKQSQGELNHTYMRCRNGRQELVRFDGNDKNKLKKVVLAERAIPVYP